MLPEISSSKAITSVLFVIFPISGLASEAILSNGFNAVLLAVHLGLRSVLYSDVLHLLFPLRDCALRI